ncbi:DsbA family protein [Stakelama saccharophila]|uniref:DsbA family protein n=1 Tax=Stakelama saccharophila TaxID=3075605 RepID=A0ABZ0B9Y9_9SPHN|nr:DsbA family protein [Stakelama sp. W311]WNO54232.1 DsbA family protein [Stakelama sp. W311]
MTESLTKTPLRLILVVLISALIGAGAFAVLQRAIPGVSADRAAMERVVHDYVLEHPEILPEAMDRLREKETAQVVAANREAIVDPFAGAWEGAKDPKATVVVYMDYACGFCRASLPEIDKLVKGDPGVRVVYRELPILSAQSETAAQWSLAAAEQGKFEKFHDTLFAADRLTEDAIRHAARVAGLDMDRAAQFAGSQEAARQIAQNLSMARQLGVTGTPAWVIGNRVTSGALPYQQLQAQIEHAKS